jgi:GNAT superfamily N-acetyltransferase
VVVAIRRATSGDRDALVAVLLRAYEGAWGPTGWDDYRTEIEDVDRRFAHAEVAVATGPGREVIGTVTVVAPSSALSSRLRADALEVRMLAVDPSARRRGVATALLGWASDRAADLGATALVLQSDADLVAAHELYRRLGFRRVESYDREVADGIMALGYERAVPTR